MKKMLDLDMDDSSAKLDELKDYMEIEIADDDVNEIVMNDDVDFAETPQKNKSMIVSDMGLSAHNIGAVHKSKRIFGCSNPPQPQTPKLSKGLENFTLEIDECLCSINCDGECKNGKYELITGGGEGVKH